MITRDWLRALPKAELHVHLEGTVTPDAYKRIALRNDLEPDDPTTVFACHDFKSFVEAFLRVVRTLRAPQDFEEIAKEYLERSLSQGVRHVEFLFSPATIRHFTPEADLLAIVEAIDRGRRCGQRAGISSVVIFDMVRNLGEVAASADLELAMACKRFGVVGVGLGGDESRFPARDFRSTFAKAQKSGLRRTVHAGETDGFQSVIDAIEILGAERIGHGVAAVHDRRALELIRSRNVAIEACLTSNRITGAWNGSGIHPIMDFLKADLATTLNSDDPEFFHASLLDEYELAAAQGVTQTQLIQVARSSFEHSFLPDEEKRTQLKQLDAYVRSCDPAP